MRNATRLTLSLVVAFVMSFTSEVSAQTSFWVESVNQFNRSIEHTAQIDGRAVRSISSNLGVYTWWLVSEGWGEAIVGFEWSPSKSVTFEVGTGVEMDGNPSRYQLGLWMGNDHASLYSAYEVGGSGYWYLVQGNVPVMRGDGLTVGLGFRAQRFVGVGPRLELDLPAHKVTVWMSGPMYDPEDKQARNFILGLKLSP